jgi:hypothetical protein
MTAKARTGSIDRIVVGIIAMVLLGRPGIGAAVAPVPGPGRHLAGVMFVAATVVRGSIQVQAKDRIDQCSVGIGR